MGIEYVDNKLNRQLLNSDKDFDLWIKKNHKLLLATEVKLSRPESYPVLLLWSKLWDEDFDSNSAFCCDFVTIKEFER